MGNQKKAGRNFKDTYTMSGKDGKEYHFTIYDVLEYENDEYAYFLVDGGRFQDDGFFITKIVWEGDRITYEPMGPAMIEILVDLFFEYHSINE